MKYSFWHQAPMIRLLLPFLTGISLAFYFPVPNKPCLISCLIFLSIFAFTHHMRFPYHRRWINGVCISLVFLFLGMFLFNHQNELTTNDHFSHLQHADRIILQLDDAGVRRKNKIRFKGIVTGIINSSGNYQPASGNVMAYIRSDSGVCQFTYGDQLIVRRNCFSLVRNRGNPGEFDYAAYMQMNNMHYTCFLNKNQVVKLERSKGFPGRTWVYIIQQYFRKVTLHYIRSANESGIAQALLFGDDDMIDADTMNAYARTGTLHVLAVSGMHVGIIFWILGLLCRPLEKNRNTRWFAKLAVLVGIWAYAAICGMSPSILRATLMFSFLILGKLIRKNGNIYNTLGATAFFLLLVNTRTLFNVGFQLSFLAVAGIIMLYPFIYRWFVPAHWFVDQIWKLISVSVAAQISTFPIGLLYFHQFSSCFLISNLIIIPLTTFILYGCMLMVIMSHVPSVAALLGNGLYGVIHFTNMITFRLEQLPFAYADGININTLQCFSLFFLVVGLIAYFSTRHLFFIKFFLASLILLNLTSFYTVFSTERKSEMIVFNSINQDLMLVKTGNKTISFGDSAYLLGQKPLPAGLPSIKELKPWPENHLVIQTGKTNILIAGPHNYLAPDTLFDLLILLHRSNLRNVGRLLFKKAVISPGVDPKERFRLIRLFRKNKIPYYCVSDSGAFTLNLHQ